MAESNNTFDGIPTLPTVSPSITYSNAYDPPDMIWNSTGVQSEPIQTEVTSSRGISVMGIALIVILLIATVLLILVPLSIFQTVTRGRRRNKQHSHPVVVADPKHHHDIQIPSGENTNNVGDYPTSYATDFAGTYGANAGGGGMGM